jgi:hypothetical protein
MKFEFGNLRSSNFDGIWPGNYSIHPNAKNKFSSNELEVHWENSLIDLGI